ncbi:MAG: diacylglycerol kinase family lipid kinase [Gammaproteobacteria bacterium]|jgi:YegS/Rv2252/BmrU family lipid kinase
MAKEPDSTPPIATLIVNPKAGKGRGRRYARRLRRYLEGSGLRFRAVFSRAPGDVEARSFAACRAGCRQIVVVGGDGTVHEAVNGMLRAGTGTALGLVPLGTGNDFAKAVGLPSDWRQACDRVVEQIRAGPRRIDAGRCNDFFFANGIGVGLDARVTQASEQLKWLPGSLSYVAALAKVMIDGIPRTVARITHDGVRLQQDISLISVCNGQYIGGVFLIAPAAVNDDGLLQMVVARGVNRRQVIRLAPRVIKGTHTDAPEASFIDGRRFTIEMEKPMPVEADGEIRYTEARRLEIEILAGALPVLA